MDNQSLEILIRELRIQNGRQYSESAYFFVLEALDYTMFVVGKSREHGEVKHLSCSELLDGIRKYASEEFGPMAPHTFSSWGIERTGDFGDLVFQMCDIGLLSRQKEDRAELFHEAFDFAEAFAQ